MSYKLFVSFVIEKKIIENMSTVSQISLPATEKILPVYYNYNSYCSSDCDSHFILTYNNNKKSYNI